MLTSESDSNESVVSGFWNKIGDLGGCRTLAGTGHRTRSGLLVNKIGEVGCWTLAGSRTPGGIMNKIGDLLAAGISSEDCPEDVVVSSNEWRGSTFIESVVVPILSEAVPPSSASMESPTELILSEPGSSTYATISGADDAVSSEGG